MDITFDKMNLRREKYISEEDKTMSNGDYGYFGKGDTGYAQYVAAETTTTMVVAAGTAADAAA